ncbi:MAG: alpha-E domain-containing protein [Acidobacteriota bacterium]
MLSRVADSLYWMSRYLERAEHTARLIDVTLNLMLDQSPLMAERRWQLVMSGLGLPPTDTRDAYKLTESLAFDAENPGSIVSSIIAARENARQVREQISSEMWEELNRLYLQVKSARIEQIWNFGSHAYFRNVKEGAHLFQGITDSTMSHGQGWRFIQVGRFIERAGATAALLDAHFKYLSDPNIESDGKSDYLEWVGLLKCCTAFEACCKVYSADLQPDRIAEFLLLNADFPHSVRFSADMLQAGLNAIAEATQTHKSSRANRLAGKLRAALSFVQIEEIMESDLHSYLKDIERQCLQIHDAIYQAYITYQIESAPVS